MNHRTRVGVVAFAVLSLLLIEDVFVVTALKNNEQNQQVKQQQQQQRQLLLSTAAEQAVIEDLQLWLDNFTTYEDMVVGVSTFVVAGGDNNNNDNSIHVVASGDAVISEVYDEVTNETVITGSTIPVNADNTHFMMASVSKTITYTALSILLDADDQFFELDDDINDALPFNIRNPYFPNEPITYRHLFTHTSGIIDSWDGYLYGSNNCRPSSSNNNPNNPNNQQPYPAASLLNTIRKGTQGRNKWSPDNVPGSVHLYSNYGSSLAALLVEQHSNMPFPEFTKKFIFDPIGMTSSQWIRPIDNTAAEQYTLLDDNNSTNSTSATINIPEFAAYVGGYCFPDYPSGQLWSTASDMAKFAYVMLHRGQLFSPDASSGGADCLYSTSTGQLVFEPIIDVTDDDDDEQQQQVGLGWFIGGSSYPNGVGHDGSEVGTTADLYLDLVSNVAIGFMANSNLDENQHAPLLNKLLQTAKTMGPISSYDSNGSSSSSSCTTTWDALSISTTNNNQQQPIRTSSSSTAEKQQQQEQNQVVAKEEKITTTTTSATNGSVNNNDKENSIETIMVTKDDTTTTIDTDATITDNKESKISSTTTTTESITKDKQQEEEEEEEIEMESETPSSSLSSSSSSSSSSTITTTNRIGLSTTNIIMITTSFGILVSNLLPMTIMF